MRAWGLGALALLALIMAGCSSNATPVAVTVTTAISSSTSLSVTVLVNASLQYNATVTGASSTTVFWQICMPSVSNTVAPTNCTQGVGPTQCKIPSVSKPLVGFGTITANGLYTAPAAPPQPDSFWIVATSCVKPTEFGKLTTIIDSGIRVHISPSSASLGTGENLQFTANVTGTLNAGVTWAVCQSGAAGANNCTPCNTSGAQGEITCSGNYTAPMTAQSVAIQAIASADPNQSATVTVTIILETPPTLAASPFNPSVAAAGSVQQDVYVTGTNFLSTTSVVAGGVTVPTANVTLISSTLLRVTIPAAQLAQAGTIQLGVKGQTQNSATTASFSVVTVRPGVVAASPASVAQNSAANPNVIVTGGYFSPMAFVNGNPIGTTATFNGQSVSATVTSSRQLSLSIPTGALSTPGLYPIAVENSGVVAGNPVTFMAALNLGVTPVPGLIPMAPVKSVGVGSSPSAVAIDEADGLAVVANKASGTVSLIDLASDMVIGGPIAVGNQPTGVAVDDLLTDPTAFVVNSADLTVSAIDLKTKTVVGAAVSIAIGPKATSPIPLSIGVNPITHRALVAYQSSNEATVLDISTGNPTVVQQVGAGFASFASGASPEVGIDPRLNWAVITPGGSGGVAMVDLGYNQGAGQPTGRAPQVIGALGGGIFTTLEGIGINSETHEGLLSDPRTGTLTTFNLLDGSVKTVTQGATAFSQLGSGAAAVSALENVGIAVSGTASGSSAAIVDLESGVVLQTVGGFTGGSAPNVQAVVVDPVSNQAVAVDQANGQVFIVSLGPPINSLQIVEASPANVFGGPGTANAQLAIVGSGFVSGTSRVLLDGTAIATTFVSSRQLQATVPAGMLAVPRRYAVQVQNGASVSNVSDLAVIQAVPVGKSPVGVAVDTIRDLAVVTNSTDGTASLVALSSGTPVGPTQTPAGAIGVVGSPITVGTTPEGVALLPRLGLALVANNGSNDASVIDVTQAKVPAPVTLCGATCTAPTGVAVNQDSATGIVTNANPGSATTSGSVSFVAMTTASSTSSPALDHNPVAVAIDPNPLFPYAAVATDSSNSSIQFLNNANGALVNRVSGLANPSGIIFDPVNQIFLAANSLLNQVVLIDPASFEQTPVSVGIGPTSLDYDFQTSTLVTANSVSHTMSILSYICPPSPAVPACLGPQVRAVIGLSGTQAAVPVFGPNAIAVDPMLNLAVLVDQDNNQVLLVPLEH